MYVHKEQLEIPMGSDRDIVQYVTTANCESNLEKPVLTIVFHIFPHVRDWIRSTCVIVDLNSPTSVELSDDVETKLRVLSHAIILGPAFTEDSCILQLYERLNAASTSLGTKCVSKNDHNRILSELQFDMYSISKSLLRSNIIEEVFGQLLARDKENKFSINVTAEKLIPISDLVTSMGMTQWAGALLEQARLVYDGFNLRPLILALNMVPVVEWTSSDYFGFSDEITRIGTTFQEVRDQPFIGLQVHSHDLYGNQRWPRLALIGQKYYIKCRESVEFKSYDSLDIDFTDLAQLTRGSIDGYRCRLILDLIPPTKALGLAAKIGSLPLKEAKLLMNPKTCLMEMEVMFHLLHARITCEWRDDFSRHLSVNNFVRTSEIIATLFLKAAASRFSELLVWIGKKDPPNGSAMVDKLKKVLIEEMNTEFQRHLGMFKTSARPPLFVMEAAQYRFVLLSSKIYFTIRTVSYKKVDGLMEEIRGLQKQMDELN